MKLLYQTPELAKLCTDKREATRLLGETCVKYLKRRIKQIEAADSIEDLFQGPGKWHPLKGDRKGEFAASLMGGWRLVTTFNKTTDGLVATLEHVEDYHDG